MSLSAKRIVLAARPDGDPKLTDFREESFSVPTPGPGQVLLRTIWLSLDPYMRGRITDRPSYRPPLPIGDVMVGGTVSEVIASNDATFAKRDIVLSHSGWQSHALSDGSTLRKIDPMLSPISTALGVLGMPGMTAYVGLLEFGKPQPGETVVVAAASGAVGSAAGQIAKLKGARVVGIAGGPEKCRYVRDELGFDDCIDHREGRLAGRLKNACPEGIDVYFENVGGRIFEAVFPLLNLFARVPICGLIADYPSTESEPAPEWARGVMRAILVKRLTFRGFIVDDSEALRHDFHRDMSQWLRDGRMKYREDVSCGLERAASAFVGLLKGENFGKRLVRIGPDPI